MAFRRRVGLIVAVPFGEDLYGFGRVLQEPLMEFFDLKNVTPAATESELKNAKVIFRILVAQAPITKGQWPRVVGVGIDTSEPPPVQFFQEDALSGHLSIVEIASDGSETITPGVSSAECEDLERYAVWSASHVESRLRDFFASRPNKFVESLRVGRTLGKDR